MIRELKYSQRACIALGSALAASISNASEVESQPGRVATQTVLAELQLTPDAFAASGISPSEANHILATVYASVSEASEGFESVCVQLDTQFDQMSSLKLQIRTLSPADPSRDQLEMDVLEAESQIESLRANKANYLSTFDLSATNAMSSDDRERFNQIRINLNRSVPMPYRTLDLSDAEWVDLRHALAVIKTNEEPPYEFEQLVTSYDGQHAVIYSRVSMDSYLTSVSNVFSSFLMNLAP